PFQPQRYWVERATSAVAGGAHDEDEARLWQAIEDNDVATLAGTLGLDGEDAAAALRPALPALSEWRRKHREQSELDSGRYRITWKNVRVPASAGPSGTWLLLVPEAHSGSPAADAVVSALEGRGATVVRQAVDAPRATKETLTAHLAEAEPAGVVSLLGLDESPHAEFAAVPAGLSATTALIQAMADTGTTPLWSLTQGAVATTAADPLTNPVQAQVWGLGRVAALEHPKLWGGLVDLPATIDRTTSDRLAALLAPGQPEDQVAVRSSAVWARRLEHAPPGEHGPGPGWKPTGTTLITGGTGGIGAHLARWLAAAGAPHLILTGRRGPEAPGADELVRELKDLGAGVTIAACDAADRAQVEETLRLVPADQPLTTVVHAAGVTSYVPIADLTPATLSEVLGPKSYGAAHLHELTRDHPVTTFLMFSSGAATWGSGQQGAYAAANHYLDALAQHRRTRHQAGTSLAWGLWSDVGMVADQASTDFLSRFGIRPLHPDLATKALHQAVTAGTTTLTIADVDWAQFTPTFTTARPAPLLTDLPENRQAAAAPGGGAVTPLVEELTAASAAQRAQLLLQHVQTQTAATLGLPSRDAVPPHKPFQELGFDSLTAVQLRNQLNASTGLHLPTTLVFDQPTPHELAEYLHGELVDQDTPTEGSILATLDRWEAACASDEVDAASRRRIAVRMRSLLTTLTGDPAASRGDLETATADDMFELISKEFGKS
ncbi:SDR family NAD(P)-dependent oxidoreductase, partial [Actinomadura sp. DC4]|uniref:SDR family NAD(P)-dependent oxidoreductase n=1 Tax=Actinomadura sp. DC4 TaxID=3055069 RepID=UPI0025AF04CA